MKHTKADFPVMADTPMQYFCISGQIDGPAYGALNPNGNFANLTTFLWPRDLLIVSFISSFEAYSTVLGPAQNLLGAAVTGVASPVFALQGVPNNGLNSALTNVFAVVTGMPAFYPAQAIDPASPPISVQSSDLSYTYPPGLGVKLIANQPLSLYGALSANTVYDSVFMGLHFAAIEIPP